VSESRGLKLGRVRALDAEWLAAKFWPRVEKTETCWLWTGALVKLYGQIHLGTVEGRSVTWTTHQLSWLVDGREITAGYELDHLCRVKRCCNPDHLDPVTHHINGVRAWAHVTHCPKGHEYTESNTIRSGPHKTRRACRACYLVTQRNIRLNRKAASR
jgi:hypothetical protein